MRLFTRKARVREMYLQLQIVPYIANKVVQNMLQRAQLGRYLIYECCSDTKSMTKSVWRNERGVPLQIYSLPLC